MELLCPAGNMASLKAAINAGADAVYLGVKDNTNARSFAGLNFTPDTLKDAAKLLRRSGKKMYLAINTFAQTGVEQRWHDAIDAAADYGADALIMADLSLLDYATTHHPQVPLHLSVQASVSNATALNFYQQQFNIRRAVLPRVLSLQQIKDISRQTDVELEVFAFGSLCIMAEGRCQLSSYVTGESPNRGGSCSPAKYVRWQECQGDHQTRLNNVLVDSTAEHETIGYPVICKGRYIAEHGEQPEFMLESPTSLSTLELLPELARAGVNSLKIEGRQRSPAYVSQVTKVWRQAVDRYLAAPEQFFTEAHWHEALRKVSEGQVTTLGAYDRSWQ
ncbi:U32 family peptidase [Shewanella avicenniae]|uniref:Ubiquinone biosynthesis protein UbiU n=1 Tax=Shewanella avicenniae TaxID=2814294 RepID=A0ABX7QVS1_9GAMM|nr:peptidase U32 family protein [Shewanella avicenniae]QSX34745.1 U32 family peptidase [Shewanella avicenniae]